MTNTDGRLAGIETGVTEVRTGIALLADEMRLHGELLGRIIEMLTPETEPSGTPLHELIALLIGRLDRQSLMLREILSAQGSLARNLPFDVARAIDDKPMPGAASPEGAHGTGQGANGSGQQP